MLLPQPQMPRLRPQNIPHLPGYLPEHHPMQPVLLAQQRATLVVLSTISNSVIAQNRWMTTDGAPIRITYLLDLRVRHLIHILS